MSSSRSYTPVATAPTQTAGSSDAARRRELRAPILVVAGLQERELAGGRLVIGRDPSNEICIADPLVSRRHASIMAQLDGTVVIEDLQSANGVFVNGRKVVRPNVLLCEGDRVLVGTTEISVFSLRASGKVSMGSSSELEPPKIESGKVRKELTTETVKRRRIVTTGRGAPIDMIGQFAEQLMEAGHLQDAVRALSEPLQNLLKGISVGLAVEEPVLESAAFYALKLHEWTKRATWAEYVIELHLACRRVPSKDVLIRLEELCSDGLVPDNVLVQFLVATLRGGHQTLTEDESARLLRVERLVTLAI